ncbi:MAG: TonB-dependent receptor [Bacteroidaceae bacterium]|nr:TonB-dependent receptor [Bacteroidaceae bacterium]
MRLARITLSLVVGYIAPLLPLCPLCAQSEGVCTLDSLVVTGNRHLQAVESGVPLQRLSAQDIERLGVTDAGDAMKYMSGVTVKDYGGAGGLKTVSIRGMGAQHTAVFYDGVAVGDCQSGQVDLGRFSTENLGALQFVIGQGDDIYTSARMFASAGCVSLETRLPEGNYMRATVRAASFDTYKASLLAGHSYSNGLKSSLFADYTNSAGDYGYTIDNVRGDIGGRRVNADIEALRAEANLQWSSGYAHTVRAKLYGYGSRRGVPGAVIVDNPLSSERLLSRNFFGQIHYEYVASGSVRMKAALKQNYTFDRNRQPAASVTHEYSQYETDASYTVKWQPADNFSFVFAEELFYNTLHTSNRHNAMSSVPERLTVLSAAAARYCQGWLCATASLLHSYAEEWTSKGEVAPSRSRFSPSLTLSVQPAGCGWLLRASYKDIFRLPTFNDLYYRESGNYKLRPEKSRMLNAGVAYAGSAGGWLTSLRFSLDGYCGRVEDKIVAVPGIFVWKMSNVDDVSLTGADANLSADVEFGKAARLTLAAAYSYMRAVDDGKGSPTKGHQIIYTPLHSGSLSAALHTAVADFGYSLLWSGERYRLAQNIPSTRVGGYYDHSFNVSRNWNISSAVLTARIEAMNILDRNYEIIRYYPMPGRNYRLSLTLNL